MPSSNPRQRFQDIIREIDLIRQFTAGMTFEQYRANIQVTRAVERCFQIISEAAIKLGGEAEQRCPEIPWRDIRGLGNTLRHHYDGVEEVLLWKAIQEHLEPFRMACAMQLI